MEDEASRPRPMSSEVAKSAEHEQEMPPSQRHNITSRPPPPAAEIQRSAPGGHNTVPNTSISDNEQPTSSLNPPSLNANPSGIPSDVVVRVEVPRLTRSPVSFGHEHDMSSKESRSTDQDLPAVPEKIKAFEDHHPDPRARPLSTHRVSRLGSVADNRRLTSSSYATSRGKTAGERLEPTLLAAIVEKDKYTAKAKLTSLALNTAIGLQVVLGALTTGLSASTTGHSTQIAIALLGGISTIIASYLARMRGSNEPELSITRVKDLEQFIRECEAFKMDHGHVAGELLDAKINGFRDKFEDLLGNGNGKRKLSA